MNTNQSSKSSSKVLVHHGSSMNHCEAITINARWQREPVCNSLSTTQVWQWDNGKCECIMVLVGFKCWAIIRVRDDVSVFECDSLDSAMRAFGFDPSEYTIKAAA